LTPSCTYCATGQEDPASIIATTTKCWLTRTDTTSSYKSYFRLPNRTHLSDSTAAQTRVTLCYSRIFRDKLKQSLLLTPVTPAGSPACTTERTRVLSHHHLLPTGGREGQPARTRCCVTVSIHILRITKLPTSSSNQPTLHFSKEKCLDQRARRSPHT
jgi:hypothetical protein